MKGGQSAREDTLALCCLFKYCERGVLVYFMRRFGCINLETGLGHLIQGHSCFSK